MILFTDLAVVPDSECWRRLGNGHLPKSFWDVLTKEKLLPKVTEPLDSEIVKKYREIGETRLKLLLQTWAMHKKHEWKSYDLLMRNDTMVDFLKSSLDKHFNKVVEKVYDSPSASLGDEKIADILEAACGYWGQNSPAVACLLAHVYIRDKAPDVADA